MKEIPDYFEALTGYRMWACHRNGLLVGQVHCYAWPPYKPLEAVCGRVSEEHLQKGEYVEGPLLDCDCGVHALKTLELAEQRVIDYEYGHSMYMQRSSAPFVVWGELKLWGKVIEHEVGYRAQYAYPSKIYSQHPHLAKIVGRLYGVPGGVRKLEPPKQEDDAYVALRTYFMAPQVHNFWRNTQPKPQAPPPAQTKTLHQPSLAQLKTLQSTPWQKAQAQMQAGQNPFSTNWRDMWANGFKVKKSIVTPTITFKNIPILPAPTAIVLYGGGRGGASLIQSMRATYLRATRGTP